MQMICTMPNITYDHAKKAITKHNNAAVLSKQKPSYITMQKGCKRIIAILTANIVCMCDRYTK